MVLLRPLCLGFPFLPIFHEAFSPHDFPCWLRLDKPVRFDDFLLCLPFLSWNKFFQDTIPVFLRVCKQKPDVSKHIHWDSSSIQTRWSIRWFNKYLKVPTICQALCWIRYSALSLRTYCLAGKTETVISQLNGFIFIKPFWVFANVYGDSGASQVALVVKKLSANVGEARDAH